MEAKAEERFFFDFYFYTLKSAVRCAENLPQHRRQAAAFAFGQKCCLFLCPSVDRM